VLAYLFWHRRRDDVDRGRYEDALRRFHASLDHASAVFRLDELPFGDRAPGYEDWYLVEDWAALGELNATAVDASHGGYHDAAAELVAEGWGGVYALVRGEAQPPEATSWRWKRPDDPDATVWQRQMVLGPAPEYCLAGGDAEGRVPIRGPRSS
jgi:hypothetical protein